MKSRLFKIAHTVKGQFRTFSEALTYAWKVIKLQIKLSAKPVYFKYKKVDGSIREALGTLKIGHTSKEGREPNYSVLTYFDLQQNDWRCCKVENIIF